MADTSVYENPLITRYAGREMAENFSDDKKFRLWRKLWIALAESEKELGLNITDGQIAEMKKFQNDINYDDAHKFEREVRHDVMAHVKAFGKQAKSAEPIIHLGATSCYVTDNAEVIIIDDALNIVLKKLVNVMDKLKKFALQYKSVPTLGFTHLQPAQLTTVGKRATLWLSDLEMDYIDLMHLKNTVKLRGVKGTTGTQASFLDLFNGDGEKVKVLEKKVVAKLGYSKVYGVTGQTYPRKFDYNVLCVLSQIAQSAYRFSNDIRILQNMKEIEEPFEKHQIGSSAMAYKRNPMRSERMGSLSRYVLSLPINCAVTASTQWFERTLDDSANKRIVIAQAFLAIDAILNLYMNISENLVVYEKVIPCRRRRTSRKRGRTTTSSTSSKTTRCSDPCGTGWTASSTQRTSSVAVPRRWRNLSPRRSTRSCGRTRRNWANTAKSTCNSFGNESRGILQRNLRRRRARKCLTAAAACYIIMRDRKY